MSEDRVLLFYPKKNSYLGLFIASVALSAAGFYMLVSSPSGGGTGTGLIGGIVSVGLLNLYNVWEQSKKNQSPIAYRPIIGSAVVALVLIVAILLQEKLGNAFATISIGACAAAMFGASAVYLLFRLFSKKPTVIVNDEGVIDRSSFLSVGQIAWDEIEDIMTFTYLGSEIIGIRVAEKRIRKEKLPRRMLFYRKNVVSISASSVSCPLDQFVENLKDQWNVARGRH